MSQRAALAPHQPLQILVLQRRDTWAALRRGGTTAYLIPEVFADELVDRHESLRPVFVRVPGTDFHWNSSTAGNFLEILQTRRQICVALPKTCWARGHAGRLWCPPYRERLR